MNKAIATFLFDPRYQRMKLWSALVLYTLIVALGSTPHAREAIGHIAPGFVLHSLAYALITFLLFTGSAGTAWKKSIQAFATVAVMGALDEYVQSFLSYRTAAIGDWLVDCGASIFTLVILVMITQRDADASST